MKNNNLTEISKSINKITNIYILKKLELIDLDKLKK